MAMSYTGGITVLNCGITVHKFMKMSYTGGKTVLNWYYSA